MTRVATLALLGSVAALVACSSPAPRKNPPPVDTAAASIAPPPPPAVVIPDFSKLSPPVRKQMDAAASAFREHVTHQDAPAVERAAAYGTFGELLMASDFRATAAACFANAEALAPKELRWPYYLGHIYRREGRTLEAAAAFERAARADPAFMPALVWLGNSYLDQGNADAASVQFSKALALRPDTTAALFGLGRAALLEKDYATAIQHLERVLMLDPSAEAAHHPLGLAYRAIGKMAEAEKHLSYGESAAPIVPADPLDVAVTVETATSYQVRGQRALEAANWPAAVTLFAHAVSLDPDDPELHHKLATALALGGDRAGARKEFETLTRRWPDYEKGQYSLGLMKVQEGDAGGAMVAFRRALASAPAFLEARLQLAHLLRHTNAAAAALPEYMRVLEVDPRVVEARFGRAMTLLMLKRYAEARTALEEGRTLHPQEPGFALALGRLLAAAPDARVRDGVLALAIIDAIPVAQQRIEWAIVRAMALAEAGRFDEAARLQRAAILNLERNGSSDLARAQQARLQLYEQRRPSRTPWQADEPMELPDSGIAQR